MASEDKLADESINREVGRRGDNEIQEESGAVDAIRLIANNFACSLARLLASPTDGVSTAMFAVDLEGLLRLMLMTPYVDAGGTFKVIYTQEELVQTTGEETGPTKWMKQPGQFLYVEAKDTTEAEEVFRRTYRNSMTCRYMIDSIESDHAEN